MKTRGLGLLGTIVIVSVLLDQLIKLWVEATMPLHSSIELLPFLALLHAQNTGIAFSFLSGINAGWLSVITVGITVLIFVLAMQTDPKQVFARIGFAFIIGGAIGNLIDRIFRGYVVDYVYFHLPSWSFAIFNLADAFITVGAGLVILDELISWRRAKKAKQSAK